LREPARAALDHRPRRVVLAQLPEGAVQVDWAIVASQFPSLAFAVTDVEFRRRYPGLKLTLPLDDVLRQLPRGGDPAQRDTESDRRTGGFSGAVSAALGAA